ncbi:MAG TPA: hypothetical protein VK116_16705, partial [Planctomycetota bacterium]|nr:hypothetical protein [Planctomycetota bacterium]
MRCRIDRTAGARRRGSFRPTAILTGALLALLVLHPEAVAQEADSARPDLARVKEEEALSQIQRLEEMLDRVAKLLEETEPQNAARLRMAFLRARDRMVRERMEEVVRFIEAREFDRAIDAQAEISEDLEILLAILLEREL